MRYLHTMVRVRDLDQSLDFYVNKLGLKDSQALKNALRHNENLQQLQIRV